ncbi:multicopper oxidase CueO [Pseudochrobactrum lubricantis]|uniref:multicopper oxidase CueO n=1 Tax=Pseudochrobactrum lubricantis TaxID=558172 RepID=UPI0035DD0B85
MKTLNRRQAMLFGLGGLSAVALPALHLNRASAQGAHDMHNMAPAASAAPAGVKLPHPALLQPDNSGLVKLKIAKGRHNFQAGSSAASAGINGNYFGPVLRLQNKSHVRFAIENAMDEVTTLHWHGLMIPSDMDGGPHNVINAGATWQPEFDINQPASFNWFHPHTHMETARQAHMGAAGMLHVSDGGDRERGLPDTFGTDDLFLVFQDRRVIDGDNVYAPDFMDLMHGFRGQYLTVNGAIAPVATVPQSIVRLRLLNASNSRNYHFHFSDGRMMHAIASDGGFLAKPVAVNILTIAPGERYEVLVDFSNGMAADFTSLPDDGSGRTPKLGDAQSLEHLMRFEVSDGLKADVMKLVSALEEPAAADPAKSVKTRSFVFDENMAGNMAMMRKKMMGGESSPMGQMGQMDHSKMDHSQMGQMQMPQPSKMQEMMSGEMDHGEHSARSADQMGPSLTAATSGITMSIADKPFDMSRVDVEAKLGSMEIWKLKSVEMGHPFHIHGANFRVLSKNGQAAPDYQQGWKDTVLVDGEAELLVHFKAEGKRSHPFMFHCHVLEHEDVGMMGQFVTV